MWLKRHLCWFALIFADVFWIFFAHWAVLYFGNIISLSTLDPCRIVCIILHLDFDIFFIISIECYRKNYGALENRDQPKPRKLEYFPYEALRSHVIKARCLYIFLWWEQNWSFDRSVLEREWLNQCDWKAKQTVCMWEEEKIEFFSRFFFWSFLKL